MPEPVYVEPPVVVQQPPTVYPPQVAPAPPVAAGPLEGVVSREDDIAPKEVYTTDGIYVKISDADEHPPDVDVEITVGGEEFEYEDLPAGTAIGVYGMSGAYYEVVITAIEPEEETMWFSIEPR